MIKTANIVTIEQLLKEYPLETINVAGRMKNNGGAFLYLFDEEKPKGFLQEDDGWYALFSKEKEELQRFLREFSFPERVHFSGVPLDIAEVILKSFPGYEEDWKEPCFLYYLPKEKHSDYLKGAGEPLESISEKDIDRVNHFYTYKGEGSREYLLECIQKRPSSLIRNEKGEPVSWALVREDHSMGVMYTVEEHRKKGLAMEISRDLIRKVIRTGSIPYVHIVETNTASCKLAEELGMIRWGKILWFGMKKMHEDSENH